MTDSSRLRQALHPPGYSNTGPGAAAVAATAAPRPLWPVVGADPGGAFPSLETPSNKFISGFSESDKAKLRRLREKDLRRWYLASLAQLGVDYDEELARVRQCGKLVVYKCASCAGLSGRQEFHCHSRLCPYCARQVAADRAIRARALIRRMSRPHHVVLTVKNGADHAGRRAHLWRSWRKLRNRKRFRDCFAGGFGHEETTVSAAGDWHVHFHCILDGAMPWEELRALWQSCTGDSLIVYITPCDEGAAAEVAKYAAKLNQELLRSPAHVLEYLESAKGNRTYFTFGSCYGVDLDADPDLLAEGMTADDQADDDARHHCPYCGADSTLLHRVEKVGVRLDRPWERSDCIALAGGWYVRAGP